VRCDECAEEARDKAAGWVAIRIDLPDDPPAEIAVYCLGAQ
jgi:hypothetical protein